MALAAKLQLRQSQSLVMTPQLLQSIKLLQMTHPELERFIDDEIERNPLLARAEPRDDAVDIQPPNTPRAEDTGNNSGEAEADWSSASISEKLDASLENVFPDDPGVDQRLGPDLAAQWKSAAGSSGAGTGTSDFDMDDMAAPATTLRDIVTEQIAFGFLSPQDHLIAHDLADALDEAGYLRAELSETANRLGVEADAVLRVLTACQAFDPPGLFARDLAECLALQLSSRDRLDPAMQALVQNLDSLARRDFQALKRLCQVDDEDLVDMVAEIRSLDPRPGLAFSGGSADTIVPDIEVRPAADGSWTVELNADALPRVLVDQVYFAEVSSGAKNQEEKSFLAECLQNATWLTRSLDQRAKTILKVASEIVRQQDAFLLHGIRHLRPLNLRAIADAIGMHESTISRVTANKYMLTPRGVFELRYFFTAAIASADGGDAHSSEAVRDRVRQLIEAESPSEILSDDDIVDLLQQGGIEIARRTVAKYREAMGIPSSVQRRREKRAIAMARR
ncbi:RNA polymerase sigma-54 factor [Pseudaminobacter arsenicus]|uniref:RNA polymerase sigma-54 factor n=1 Tax=Borborobacter arsenicus TaxID=1851146 RepID=A0A432V2X0_9HYPH|nr:RNA polymerase factor sigma-54 [Pseudaminobacter arsenicus]RUM96531.1 RNA polymerase sigma-54 factor [Pseudaminobacter arsenicus]